MADQVIPVTSDANQSFPVTLSVDGGNITLQLAFRYNEVAGYWVMTIWDAQGNLLLDSIPLVTGGYPAANLLCQNAYLAIGSAYVINVGNDPGDHPNASNLGSSYILIWGDTPAF
jgi:hypothetical protein